MLIPGLKTQNCFFNPGKPMHRLRLFDTRCRVHTPEVEPKGPTRRSDTRH